MNSRPLLAMLVAAPFALVSAVHAQAPAAPAPAAALPSIPSHSCVAPEYPGKLANNDKIKAFNAAYAAYGDCIRKYVESVRALRDAAMTKGNDAVNEYNKFTEDIKKQMDAEK